MAYLHDVFLSYIRRPPSGKWVHEHFLPNFRPALADALRGRDPSVFVDREEILAGQKWPARLKQALSHSRCLLGIWSPSYFQSTWCLCECEVIRFRERQLGLGTPERPFGLILAAKVNDGIHFPQFARETQYADFEQLFYAHPAFSQSPKYMTFIDQVRELAVATARVIDSAPPWHPEWASQEWVDDVIANTSAPPPPRAEQPLIK